MAAIANEFNRPHPYFSYTFTITNVGAGTTPVDGVMAGGNGLGGPTVATGWRFYPVHVTAEYNDARTAGDSTVKVTADGTELVNGPEALIDATNTTNDDGSANFGPFVDSGEEISVSATGDGSYAPTTGDATVVVEGFYAQDE